MKVEELDKKVDEAREKEKLAHEKWRSVLTIWCRTGGDERRALHGKIKALDEVWQKAKTEVDEAISQLRKAKREVAHHAMTGE